MIPQPQACHACDAKFAGSHCPICKEPRPAYTALKNMTRRAHHGVTPLRDPKSCKYDPKTICGCEHRGFCLDAA